MWRRWMTDGLQSNSRMDCNPIRPIQSISRARWITNNRHTNPRRRQLATRRPPTQLHTFFFLSRFSSSISPFNHQYSNTNPIINSINSYFSRFFLVSLNDHWTPEAADNPPFLISYLKNDTVKISFIINSIISIRLHFRIHCGCPPSFI